MGQYRANYCKNGSCVTTTREALHFGDDDIV